MQNNDGPDFYRVLGLAPDAGEEEIKKSYRKLARQYHPDIAGDDPNVAERFAAIKRAYEVLSDPELKFAYDNRNAQRPGRNRRFHRSSWRMPGSPRQEARSKNDRFKKRRWADPANHVSIDGLFGSEENRTDGKAGDQNKGSYERGDTPGQDIPVTVSVERSILQNGGTVMVEYQRLVRTPHGEMVPYEEIYALRVPPGTPNGSMLVGERYGHDSPDGGRAGDLICDIVVATSDGLPSNESPNSSHNITEPPAGIDAIVDISIAEAILGGRVSVYTPHGQVVVGIPPRTSSGQRLRLRAKGENGTDWIVSTRIVVPQTLDSESEDLIRRFAMLNPDSTGH